MKRLFCSRMLVLSAVVAVLTVSVGSARAERWAGTIVLPNRMVDIVVDFSKQADGSWGAELAVPAQKVTGLKLSDVKYEADKIEFTLEKPKLSKLAWEYYRLERKPNADEARGALELQSFEFFVIMKRLGKGDKPQTLIKRPQTPKPPFPYNVREVLYDNPSDKSKLAGTLTLPKGKGPHPAVLLITGSGAQDRDETIFAHKPFLVIADHLSRNGFVVLRVDDRGQGKTTGDPQKATIQTHATDVMAGVAFLKQQKEVNPKKIGLLGHSEGGIIAPLVASQSADVAFVISLAGTGLPGAQINPLQVEAILKADGKVSAEGIKKIVQIQKKLMDMVKKDADAAALHAAVLEGTTEALKYMPEEDRKGLTEEDIKQRATIEAARVASPWFRSFVKLDPRKLWSKVFCPTLALVGEKDTQVPADVNLKAIADALKQGGNRDVTTIKAPKLNHLFQTSKTGLLLEYGEIEETFHQPTLELITQWLKKRAFK